MSRKVRKIDFSPDEFIAGVTGRFTPEDLGVYWLVCALIYSKRGPIDDDHIWIARLFADTHWRKVRASLDRLIAAAKITQEGGKLWVKRCAEELHSADTRIASATQNGGKGGRPRKENKEIEKPDGLQPKNPDEKLSPSPSSPPSSPPSAAPLGWDERYPVVRQHCEELLNNPRCLVWGRVNAWLQQGADPELDIYPTLTRCKDRWRGGALEYFDQAIADAIASRTKPLPASAPRAGAKPEVDPGTYEENLWFGRLTVAATTRRWERQWGKPEHIPQHIREKFPDLIASLPKPKDAA